MDLNLTSKTALVTGSHRGTGAGIAQVLAAEGASVVVHGLEAGQPDPIVAAIREAGGNASSVTGDPRSEEGADEIARGLATHGHPIDILVNNYGAAAGGGWLDGSSEDWTSMFETNVLSGVRLVRRLAGDMKSRGWGRIVFVGTVGSVRPRKQTPGYYAAKASLPAMTVSLSKELSGSGVTVNLISPGLIATAEVRAMVERRAEKKGWTGSWEELEKRAASDFMPTPSGRIARPDEVGALVAFVCSGWAASINGADLRIDGGAADCV
ncbi:MAG: SDR family oxidoreductase [Candidatus Binatia bacterium]|nr:SDR family oxidoreductase [Candidatus Binatia bacterium]